jgi:hypothetical protein
MKKDLHFLLSVGLCFSIATIQSAPQSKMLSPNQLALATGLIASAIFYYKKLAASPHFPAELPKDATQLEKLAHYFYHEVLGYESKRTFKKTRNGDYRESKRPAKGLGWLYSECSDIAKIFSIPAAIFGFEKFIYTLMAKEI